MITHGVEVVVASNFNYDFVFVRLQQLKVDVVWVGEPHGMISRSSPTVNVLNDDELALAITHS